jgi:FkbM family methyltransferase
MSTALSNARLMAVLHRLGTIPDYERILEITYRLFISKGGTVVDIGAHTGRHTAVFADLVGEAGMVHAIEPLPDAVKSFRLRNLGNNVKLHQLAISTKNGVVPFIYAQGTPEESGLRVKSYNQPSLTVPRKIEVKTCPLDDVLHNVDKIDFIKIDAEGAEIECLKSGVNIISRTRPLISVEYGYPGYSAFGLERKALFDQASKIGYVIGDLFGGLCETSDIWNDVCDIAYWDWYLIPREKVDEWRAILPMKLLT